MSCEMDVDYIYRSEYYIVCMRQSINQWINVPKTNEMAWFDLNWVELPRYSFLVDFRSISLVLFILLPFLLAQRLQRLCILFSPLSPPPLPLLVYCWVLFLFPNSFSIILIYRIHSRIHFGIHPWMETYVYTTHYVWGVQQRPAVPPRVLTSLTFPHTLSLF